ncbi:hypothetical protein EXIGLDRAFT_723997 [Exidia glandulosa HHB12029]|uniref:C2H2-type domain-containing protein n=1 Tax=Exidia glandulosa HHB12029 TaxID=1314781 RepID=A0A165ELS0_EXIGL|nr:hypothetical protein EXIGLDRAFT_723997 [Exidia glandulosa HHB12029]
MAKPCLWRRSNKCGYTFSDDTALFQHILHDHPDVAQFKIRPAGPKSSDFVCMWRDCGRVIKAGLLVDACCIQAHIHSHTPEHRLFKCDDDDCIAAFTSRAELEQHERVAHAGEDSESDSADDDDDDDVRDYENDSDHDHDHDYSHTHNRNHDYDHDATASHGAAASREDKHVCVIAVQPEQPVQFRRRVSLPHWHRKMKDDELIEFECRWAGCEVTVLGSAALDDHLSYHFATQTAAPFSCGCGLCYNEPFQDYRKFKQHVWQRYREDDFKPIACDVGTCKRRFTNHQGLSMHRSHSHGPGPSRKKKKKKGGWIVKKLAPDQCMRTGR